MDDTQQIEPVATESNAAVQDDAAAFESGYAGEPIKPSAAEAEPPKEEVEPPKEEPPKEEAPPWKAEFDSVREQLAGLQKLAERVRNTEGHIGNITSQLKTVKAQAAAVTSAGGEAPTAAQIEQAVLSPEKLKALEEDYPDIAEPIKQLQAALSATRAELAKRPQFDGESIKTEITGSVAQQIAEARDQARTEARNLALVDFKHPGWEESVQSPEFQTWYGKQAPEVQALAQSPKAQDAIAMLDAFAAAKAKAEKDKQQKEANERRLRGAVQPKGQPAATPTTLTDEEAFELGYKSAG